MRKPIQISCCSVQASASTNTEIITIALCDDGTIWGTNDQINEWIKLPDIPQDKRRKYGNTRSKI